jgi:hypothetical protein
MIRTTRGAQLSNWNDHVANQTSIQLDQVGVWTLAWTAQDCLQIHRRGSSARCLFLRATGGDSDLRGRISAQGFLRDDLKGSKRVHGFQIRARVRAAVSQKKKVGVAIGRVAIRQSSCLHIQTAEGTVQGICYRDCKRLARADGYDYQIIQLKQERDCLPPRQRGGSIASI